MGGRVVECAGLENRYSGNVIVGSNPTPSAIRGGFPKFVDIQSKISLVTLMP